ncbi:MAG: hypothetical protein M8861_08025 [marine benthic group bacterium]|nr:hypothetical protein [Gemmatimonadota bacterium]
MDVGHVIPEAIRELLEQRGTYQGWLTRLDELGSEFRPEVAEKVRGDYAGRLATVETELEGHRTELETALADRTAAVDKVAGEHDARSAELEETQLRHVVGEFDDEEWERRRAEHQVGIDELEAELTTQRSAVESLQTVLGELTGAAAVVAVAEEVELEPPVPAELAVVEDEWTESSPDEGADQAEADDAPEPLDSAGDTAWMTQPFAEVAEETAEPEGDPEAQAELEVEPESEVETGVDSETEAEEAVEPAEEAQDVPVEAVEETEPVLVEAEPDEFMDELEFLESLSLDDADSFDAVSAMLDEDGESKGDGESRDKTEEH